ncbi:hypothetical protein [Paenibacillus sp. GCM10027626]|uniref:hypothetical protein n=1 Tax=Paenibacillus sp. GCM10027626 TaxID=3273411 RepID=UPI00363A73A7
MSRPLLLAVGNENKRLNWNIADDEAILTDLKSGRVIWKGGLLPAWELAARDSHIYVKARAWALESNEEGGFTIKFALDGYGTGTMECEAAECKLRLSRLQVDWDKETAVVALYFGTRLMTPLELSRAPRTDKSFWPDWSADGYCVPAAGSNPTSSFFRSWDMGDARLPLGSFGDAMGTPYAAAFPRPIYAAAMGGHSGWAAFGPGEVPDGALALQLQATTCCLYYLYREDLWGAPPGLRRVWNEPLRISWGDSGYEALSSLYRTFGPFTPKDERHQRSFLCTWGDFKEGRFDLQRFTERVAAETPADMIILDDHWETYNGSAEPNLELFPDFEGDLQRMRDSGYEVAFWQSIGWIDQPELSGLTDEDLLCGVNGVPRQWRWSGNPLAGSGYHYCLDPSSPNTRAFITQRTKRLIRTWKPAALKLDFGYGFPGPDACVPRNTAFRGERLAYELLRLIVEAAKEEDPSITIIYYGIHPLLHDVTDMINIDDLGDAGDSAAYERSGHNQRCLWTSLAAAHGMAINTSTGYYWGAFSSILLDTAVVGANGLTLGEFDSQGKRINPFLLNRWHALQAWRRRSCGWKPLWLEAELGGLGAEPNIVSWGRIETANGQDIVTAFALRGIPEQRTKPWTGYEREQAGCDSSGSLDAFSSFSSYGNYGSSNGKRYEQAEYIRFTGDWALIAQDHCDVRSSRKLACIPFRPGVLLLKRNFAAVTSYGVVEGALKPLHTWTCEDLPGLRLEIHEEELERIAGFIVE